MPKAGRPRIEGRRVVVKLPKNLLEELDVVWPHAGSLSRNDFIRKAIWGEIQRTRSNSRMDA